METWDAITARRATREYDDTPLAEADLERILEAGRRAPSASNNQRMGFRPNPGSCTVGEDLSRLARRGPHRQRRRSSRAWWPRSVTIYVSLR